MDREGFELSLFHCSFYSKILRTMAKVEVVLPSPGSQESAVMSLEELYNKKIQYPVLYLLHGMNQDETVWLRKSNVERYAQEKGIALVMPYGENNYYTDMVHGLQYFTFLTEELPRFIQFSFPVLKEREHTFIAGLSMGGYGACKAALLKPEQYSAATCLSGAVDIELMAGLAKEQGMEQLVENIFGTMDNFNTSSSNLFYAAKELKESQKPIPKIYIACGTDDVECYGMNLKLKQCFENLSFPITYVEEKGKHEWDFWEKQIKKVLEWLPVGVKWSFEYGNESK